MIATFRFLIAGWLDVLVGPFRRLPTAERMVVGRRLTIGFTVGVLVGVGLSWA